MPEVPKFDIEKCLKTNSKIICELIQSLRSGYKIKLRHYIPATRFGRHRRDAETIDSNIRNIEIIACAFVVVGVVCYVAYRYYQRSTTAITETISDSNRDLEVRQPLKNQNENEFMISGCIELQNSIDVQIECQLPSN